MSLMAFAHAPASAPSALTPAAMAFYATVATFVPVLYLAVAVQGNSSQSMFGAARAIMKPIIRSLTKTMFRNLTTDGPEKKTEIIRQNAVIVRRASFIIAVVSTIPLVAGAWGETLAVYALYQGQDTSRTRTIVLLTAIFLISAVAAGPAITFVKTFSAFARQIFKDVLKEVIVGGVVQEVIVKKVVAEGITKKSGSMTKKYRAIADKFLSALEKDLPDESPGSSQAEPDRPEIGQTDPAQDQK